MARTGTSRKRGTYRDDHGTPDWVLDLHRATFDKIDIDLASNAIDQMRIGARIWYSAQKPCPAKLAFDVAGRVVWCNPPGPSAGVIWFWKTWCDCIRRGAEGSFLVFSIDHVRMLQNESDVLLHATFLPRLKFTGNKQQAAIASVLVSTKPIRSKFVTMEWAPCNS